MSDLETKCSIVIDVIELRGKSHAEAYEAISKIIGPITEETCELKEHETHGSEDDIWEHKGEVSSFYFSPMRHNGYSAEYDHSNKRWGISALQLKGTGEASGGIFTMFLTFTEAAKIAKKLGKKISKAGYTPGEPCIEAKTWYNGSEEPVNVGPDFPEEQPPYLEKFVGKIKRKYNPEYGDDRICKCGHLYHRHFDSYENNRNVGCKYCRCCDFKESEDGAEGNDD